MATVHYNGTLSGAANAAALGTLIAEKIRDELVAHAAWELVEEYSPGTAVHYVFRCLASANDLTDDFYLIMTRTISTGLLSFFVSEGYNSGTHVVSLYPTTNATQSSSNTHTYDSDGRQTSQTYTLVAGAIGTSANQPRFHSFTPTGTSCQYNFIVYDDGMVWLQHTNPAATWYYCGAYEWLGTAIANDNPVHHQGSASLVSNPSNITRNPLVAGGAGSQYACVTRNGPGGGGIDAAELLGYAMDVDSKCAFQGDVTPVAEYLVIMDSMLSPQGSNPSTDVIGKVAGKWKHMRVGSGQGSSFVFGDAYDIDGTLWVPHIYTSGTPLLFDTGVAA